jgi:photosystem II stability/assembly factor-like uncharacterized protein
MKKVVLNLSILFLIISIISFSTSCDSDSNQEGNISWKKIGLNGLKVNKLELINNNLYAVTSDGLYVKNINSSSSFISIGLQGKNLLDVAIFNTNHILASFRNESNGEDTKIYETLNGGTTWSVKNTNFGIIQFPEAVNDFEWDEISNTLYATGYGVLAKSIDYGTNWEILWGDWANIGTGMMINKNPFKEKDLWFGGQGGIENGYLVNSFNNSVREWNDLVPNPSVVKAIAFDNQSPQNIYVGWEGELSKSNDHGNTWTTLIDRHQEAHFFFGIGISQNNPNIIYTGKWIKGVTSQPLEIYYSSDEGITWKSEIFQSENKGGIFDLKVKSEENQDRIFVALDGGGIYEFINKTN